MIIACLGNPGAEYSETRHNIGFMVADRLAQDHSAPWIERKPLLDQAEYKYARRSVILIKPMTYMNLSGSAIKSVMLERKMTPNDVIVVVDEYNFPTGRINLRPSGSDGGHNGLTSVIEELRTPNFWRLRCGIDRNFGPGGLVDYVLGTFPPEEHALRDQMIIDACRALDEITKHGPQRAMKAINSLPEAT